jgi:hypothetical protein
MPMITIEKVDITLDVFVCNFLILIIFVILIKE